MMCVCFTFSETFKEIQTLIFSLLSESWQLKKSKKNLRERVRFNDDRVSCGLEMRVVAPVFGPE